MAIAAGRARFIIMGIRSLSVYRQDGVILDVVYDINISVELINDSFKTTAYLFTKKKGRRGALIKWGG